MLLFENNLKRILKFFEKYFGEIFLKILLENF